MVSFSAGCYFNNIILSTGVMSRLCVFVCVCLCLFVLFCARLFVCVCVHAWRHDCVCVYGRGSYSMVVCHSTFFCVGAQAKTSIKRWNAWNACVNTLSVLDSHIEVIYQLVNLSNTSDTSYLNKKFSSWICKFIYSYLVFGQD